MARHAKLVRIFERMTREGVIDGYTRSAYPNEPNRVRWHLMTHHKNGNPIMKMYSTLEAEAFIDGARCAYRHLGGHAQRWQDPET